MQAYELYKDIAERTQGDVYIGVVGPVRAGKSTFISRFMDKLVLPGIENPYIKNRILDELPQSGSGRTVMTTQPAFIPNEAVEVLLPSENRIRLRLIDSVGYIIAGALGTQEGDSLRMIHTPWSDSEISFERAAEIGTQKVIGEHSTIGLVITTDGTVTDFPREAYIPAELRAVNELKSLNKPFIMVLNTAEPQGEKTQSLRKTLEDNYEIPVLAMDVENIGEQDIRLILESILGQFPLISILIQTPEWISALDPSHWLAQSLAETVESAVPDILTVKDIQTLNDSLEQNTYIGCVLNKSISHGTGQAVLQMNLIDGLFNQILAEQCGTEIRNDAHLLSLLCDLVSAKKEYDRVSSAIDSVRKTGYGLVPPALDELMLQEPEIIKHGGKFGVKLRASAPSLHLIRVNVNTEVSPMVGTEQQSEEMIQYLMDGFNQDPQKLWSSNLFGKPLSDLVREGLSNKLLHMPADTQLKVQETLERIINDGTGGMNCILL